MELFCPHCQKKLTIEDQYAGQLMKCPLCSNMFTAPVLAPAQGGEPPPSPSPEPGPYAFAAGEPAAESPEAPPPPPAEGFALEPAPVPPPFDDEPTPPSVAAAPAKPAPPLPTGDYTRSWTISLNPNIVPWIAPIGLTVLFFLSFTVWYGTSKGEIDAPWHWAFTTAENVPSVAFLLFLVFTIFLALPLSIVSLLLDLQVFSLPEGMKALLPLRPIIVGSLALLGFIALAWIYLPASFHVFKDFGTVSLRLAIRVHLLVLIGLVLEICLERRRQRNLPPPRMEIRW